MPHIVAITFEDALLHFGLFDDIKIAGNYFKYYLSDDRRPRDLYIDVEIEQVRETGWVVTFKLKNPDWIKLNDNWKYMKPEYIKFTKKIDYDNNSPYLIMWEESVYFDTSDYESDDESDDEGEEV